MVVSRGFRFKSAGVAFLLFCIFHGLYGAAPERAEFRRILLVDSYCTADPWTDNLRRGLFKALNQSGLPVGAETFDLCVRYQQGLEPTRTDVDALRVKLAGTDYDLVVAANNAAAGLFLDGTLKPRGDAPVLISSYHGTLSIPAEANMTGLETPVNLYANLTLGRKLLPDNRDVTILIEGTPDGDSQMRLWKKWSESEEGREALAGLNVRVLSGDEYSSREVLDVISKLPPHSLLLAHSWSSSRETRLENGYTMLPRIRKIFPGLILGKYVGYLDYGLAGGVMVSGEDQGWHAGIMAVQILRGKRAGEIPVQKGQVKTILDYPSLTGAGVSEANIPPDAALLNKPKNFLRRNLPAIFKITGALLVLSLLVLVRQQMSRRAMKKIRDICMNIPQRIGIVDAQGNILYSNTRHKHLLFKHLRDLPEEHRDDLTGKIQETFLTGRKQAWDYHLENREMHSEFVLLPNDLYDRPTVMCITDDHSELSRAHREAALAAERLRMTLEAIGEGVIATDAGLQVTLLNPVAAELIGIDREEARGRNLEEIFKLVSDLDGQPAEISLKRALRTGENTKSADQLVLLSLDGKRYRVAGNAAPILDPEGVVTGGVLVFRDVTEECSNRDRLQGALTSLEYGSTLTNSASFTMDLETREVFSGSKLLPELWKLRDGKAIPREEYIYPDDLERYIRSSDAILSGECDINTWEYRSNFSGELRYYRMRASIDRSNSSPRLVGVVQDVTEIARSVGKLKETLEFWGLVINSLPIMFFIKDADNDFRYTLCNKAYADFHGRTPEEVIGRTDAELFSRPGDVEFFRGKDIGVLNRPEGDKYEETFADATGRLYYGQALKKPFTGSGGQRLIFGAVSDVSELTHLIACEQFNSEILSYSVREMDFDRVIAYIADRLKHQLGADRVMFARCNEQGQLRLDREWYLDGMPSSREAGIENHYKVWDKQLPLMRTGKVITLSDLSESEASRSFNFDNGYKIESAIEAPIMDQGELWGALIVSYVHSRRVFADVDESIMRSCANVISLAAARKRREEKIHSQERNMHLILDNIGIPITLHAADGKLLHVNSAVSRMTGMSREELFASPENEVFYAGAGNAAPPNSPLKQVIGGRKSAFADLAVNGRQYIVHADAVIDDQGKLINIVKDAIDVTKLNDLLKNHRLLNFCLETLFTEEDADKAVPTVLKAFCEHFGAARSYILRIDREKRCSYSFHEYVRREEGRILEKDTEFPLLENEPWLPILEKGDQVLIHNLNDPKQAALLGSWREYIGRSNMKSIFITGVFQQEKLWGDMGIVFEDEPCLRFKESDRKLLHAAAHLIEVMLERKAAHERLLQAVEQARAAEKAKSFFIASVSHEIRTPLNSVIGFSELLRHADVSAEEQKEYLSNISYSGNALLQLINDVLDLSKLEAGQMEIMPGPADFGKLGKEVMKVFSLRAIERNLNLVTEIPPLPELELDTQRIRQILFNLIGNAVKFTENGSITLRAAFEPDDDRRGTLTFMVIDTGIGIAEDDQKKLMAPYVQISNQYGKKADTGGTGLGLSISKRLSEKMGGGLWLESKPGQGSTFGVTLKGVQYHSAAKSAQTALPAAEAEQPLDPDTSILMVDDVMLNLRVLKAMCARLGLKDIVTATSAAAALEELHKRKFKLVMTDIWMPEVNGFELLEKIRSEQNFSALPVIAVTADASSTEEFTNAKFSGVLLKPITEEKLKEVIRSVTEA